MRRYCQTTWFFTVNLFFKIKVTKGLKQLRSKNQVSYDLKTKYGLKNIFLYDLVICCHTYVVINQRRLKFQTKRNTPVAVGVTRMDLDIAFFLLEGHVLKSTYKILQQRQSNLCTTLKDIFPVFESPFPSGYLGV